MIFGKLGNMRTILFLLWLCGGMQARNDSEILLVAIRSNRFVVVVPM
jgi:hypothetical protein